MQSATANSRSLFLYPYLYRVLKRDASLTRKYTRATMHSHRNNDPAIIPEMTNGTQDERSETNNHRLFFHKVLAYIAFPIAAIFFLLKRERSADFTPAPPPPPLPSIRHLGNIFRQHLFAESTEEAHLQKRDAYLVSLIGFNPPSFEMIFSNLRELDPRSAKGTYRVQQMLLIILSPRFIRILLGWDRILLGLVSYCLVIYYQNYRCYNSRIVTVLSNGRCGFISYYYWSYSYVW